MKLAAVLERIWANHHEVTEDEIRGIFGDYHNVLKWLANFLTADEKLAETCVIDACTIAQTQTPVFREWLVHWAARATVRSALATQREQIIKLAPDYEIGAPVPEEATPLSAEQLRLIIDNSTKIQARLDVLCRFVLVLRGIAKASFEEVADQLGISVAAIVNAYSLAIETLDSRDALVISSHAQPVRATENGFNGAPQQCGRCPALS